MEGGLLGAEDEELSLGARAEASIPQTFSSLQLVLPGMAMATAKLADKPKAAEPAAAAAGENLLALEDALNLHAVA